MANANFRLYDPIADVIAEGNVGGSGLPLTGGTLTGDLIMNIPAKIIQCTPPTNPCDVANMAYVLSSVTTSNATTTTSGKVQLAGDLGGTGTTASAPVISNNAINNAKMVNMSAISQLKGSSDSSTAVTDISLGSGLQTVGTVLQVDYTKVQPTVSSAIPGHVAIFGSGLTTGQTIDSNYSIDSEPSNSESLTTLWSSKRTTISFQYGAVVFKATSPINLLGSTNVRAFSTGNASAGPNIWPNNLGAVYNLASNGIATITSNLPFNTYYLLTFIANSMQDDGLFGEGSLTFQFKDENGPFISIIKTLKVFITPQLTEFCNEISLNTLVMVPPNGTFNFSVVVTNVGTNKILDPNTPTSDASLLIIQRVA